MAIILQSTVDGFSEDFMRALPRLERAMVNHGLAPDAFVISKDPASPSGRMPLLQPFFYAYTVSFGDAQFTVTQPNDIQFLDYFYKLCVADDDAPTSLPKLVRPKPPARRINFLHRVLSWMNQPV